MSETTNSPAGAVDTVYRTITTTQASPLTVIPGPDAVPRSAYDAISAEAQAYATEGAQLRVALVSMARERDAACQAYEAATCEAGRRVLDALVAGIAADADRAAGDSRAALELRVRTLEVERDKARRQIDAVVDARVKLSESLATALRDRDTAIENLRLENARAEALVRERDALRAELDGMTRFEDPPVECGTLQPLAPEEIAKIRAKCGACDVLRAEVERLTARLARDVVPAQEPAKPATEAPAPGEAVTRETLRGGDVVRFRGGEAWSVERVDDEGFVVVQPSRLQWVHADKPKIPWSHAHDFRCIGRRLSLAETGTPNAAKATPRVWQPGECPPVAVGQVRQDGTRRITILRDRGAGRGYRWEFVANTDDRPNAHNHESVMAMPLAEPWTEPGAKEAPSPVAASCGS